MKFNNWWSGICLPLRYYFRTGTLCTADFAVSKLGKVDILVNNAGGVGLNRLICQWQIFAALMN